MLYWLGILVIPCIFLYAQFVYNKNDAFNYSGLIEIHPVLFRILAVIVMIDYLWTSYLFGTFVNQKVKRNLFIVLLFLLLCTIFIPYHSKQSFSSSIHLLFAYSAFFVFNILLYLHVFLSEKDKQIYTLLLLFCFMHSMLHMQITGLSQTIYGAIISILLARKLKTLK